MSGQNPESMLILLASTTSTAGWADSGLVPGEAQHRRELLGFAALNTNLRKQCGARLQSCAEICRMAESSRMQKIDRIHGCRTSFLPACFDRNPEWYIPAMFLARLRRRPCDA